MKKNRFASFLLTGKAATLPFMFNSSFADVVPSYTDILSTSASLIELPATGVRLYSTTVASNLGGSSYGGTAKGTDAALCSTSLPTTMNIVITGAKPGDTVYLVASSNKDDGAYTALNAKIRVGNNDFSIVTSFALANSAIQESGGSYSKSTSPISIPIQLSNNSFIKKGIFYFQAVIFSTLDPLTMWTNARVSELDQITVSSAGCPSTYGSSY